MERFLEGLSFDFQTRLMYKEFETFEKLIEKAEMMAMAVEEARVTSRLNAFQAKYVEPNRELNKVKEDRLSTQVESNTYQKHLEENMEKMQRQKSTRRNVLFDTGAERSVISSTFFHKVDVDLFSINGTQIVTEGTITVNFFVAEETPRQALRQKFIIVNGIVEDCVLGCDALWKHQFIYNGRQQSIYRVPEIDHFQETENPL
ncbi:hypothetical protein OUZ56_033883 [Daphnia magna]|uniref:Peptidase A2 domain-containing protein n=1 Tax=Daphnia magna TaxID=35525 RepID=A0ABR0BB83_9CRUS|nr:hypothetical protein OUZ56_033883 [Daphnia magna]